MDLIKVMVDAATTGGPGFALAVTVGLAAFVSGLVVTSKAANERIAASDASHQRELAAEQRRADEYKAMFDEWGPRFDTLLDLVESSVRTRK